MAENTIKVADLAKVQDVDFVLKFNDNISKLLEVLGQTESIRMQAGTVLKAYKASGTLNTTQVGEGEEINLSKYKNELLFTKEISLKKYRKQTTLEAITKRGYEQAVTATDDAMIGDIQKAVRTEMYAFLNDATGKTSVSAATFQAAMAAAWGQLEVKFEDNYATPVYFVNPLDIATYLGTAPVTLQTAFGMSYLENFLGLGTVVVDSKVAQGTIIATAKENLNVYSVDPAGIDGFEFYTDQSGLVGVDHETIMTNMTYETYAVTGLTIFPEYADRIIIAAIGDESE